MSNPIERKRGGRRDGAGRPVAPAGTKLKPMTIRLDPETYDLVQQRGGAAYVRRLLIEDALNYSSAR